MHESSADGSFVFRFAGDTGQYGASFGPGQNGTGSFANSAASLQALPPGLSFFVDDGDISYDGTSGGCPPTENGILWCNFVKVNINPNLGPQLSLDSGGWKPRGWKFPIRQGWLH